MVCAKRFCLKFMDNLHLFFNITGFNALHNKKIWSGFVYSQQINSIFFKFVNCWQNDVATALADDGLAAAQDFICINGFTVWEKSKEEGVIEGLLAEILYGKFDVVPIEWSEEVYEELIAQNESILTTKNLVSQLELAQQAWKCAGGSTASNSSGKGTKASVDLAEMAKKSWWSTFLLGDPSLRFGWIEIYSLWTFELRSIALVKENASKDSLMQINQTLLLLVVNCLSAQLLFGSLSPSRCQWHVRLHAMPGMELLISNVLTFYSIESTTPKRRRYAMLKVAIFTARRVTVLITTCTARRHFVCSTIFIQGRSFR